MINFTWRVIMGKRSKGQVTEQVKQVLHNIGDTIKQARTNRKLTMSDLAKLSGVSSSVISDLENYKNVMPSIQTLMLIANALELPEETFIKEVWVNVAEKNANRDTLAIEKLRLALSEYGLPAVFMERVIDQINYYTSMSNIEHNYKIINLIYEHELKNGTKMEHIMLDPLIIFEAKKNIEFIKQIKERTLK